MTFGVDFTIFLLAAFACKDPQIKRKKTLMTWLSFYSLGSSSVRDVHKHVGEIDPWMGRFRLSCRDEDKMLKVQMYNVQKYKCTMYKNTNFFFFFDFLEKMKILLLPFLALFARFKIVHVEVKLQSLSQI